MGLAGRDSQEESTLTVASKDVIKVAGLLMVVKDLIRVDAELGKDLAVQSLPPCPVRHRLLGDLVIV